MTNHRDFDPREVLGYDFDRAIYRHPKELGPWVVTGVSPLEVELRPVTRDGAILSDRKLVVFSYFVAAWHRESERERLARLLRVSPACVEFNRTTAEVVVYVTSFLHEQHTVSNGQSFLPLHVVLTCVQVDTEYAGPYLCSEHAFQPDVAGRGAGALRAACWNEHGGRRRRIIDVLEERIAP